MLQRYSFEFLPPEWNAPDLITAITLSQKRQVALFGNWEEKTRARKTSWLFISTNQKKITIFLWKKKKRLEISRNSWRWATCNMEAFLSKFKLPELWESHRWLWQAGGYVGGVLICLKLITVCADYIEPCGNILMWKNRIGPMLDPAGKFQNNLAEDHRGSPMSICLSSVNYQGSWFFPSDFMAFSEYPDSQRIWFSFLKIPKLLMVWCIHSNTWF